jgi:hypothetical protein
MVEMRVAWMVDHLVEMLVDERVALWVALLVEMMAY